MTKILAFGSFKQSGKSSSCEFLVDYHKRRWGMGTKEWYTETPKSFKIYSFADKLKQFAVECLGLTHEQCYGTDDDKNSLTHLRWENMPGISTKLVVSETEIKYYAEEFNVYFHSAGFMTAREVLQHFGTGICRKMYQNIWVDATIRQIKKDNLDFALISDCRFKNEATAVQEAGGKIIGFMRRPFPNDTHQSEIDLIGYPFDATIDNTDLCLDKKNEKVLGLLKDWKWL